MRVAGLVCLAVLLTLASSCSLLEEETKDTRRELTPDDLMAMMLSLDDLGSKYIGFALMEENSGVQSNDQTIDDADDPEDERKDVERFGRITGVNAVYESPAAVFDRKGVLVIGLGINLYNDAKGAVGDLKDELNDTLRSFSGTSEYGTLQAFHRFTPGVGDESTGLVITVLTSGEDFGITGDIKMTFTGVSFLRSRVGGMVLSLSLDAEGAQKDVTDLAKKLDKRIRDALALSGPETPAGKSEPSMGVDPVEVLRRAEARSAEVKNVRILMRESISFQGETLSAEADMRVQSPDRSYGVLTIPGYPKMEMATVGFTSYVKDAGRWTCAGDLGESGLTAPNFGQQLSLASAAQTVSLVSTETLDGVPVYRIRAEMDGRGYLDAIERMLGADGEFRDALDALDVSTLEADVFIGRDDFLARRMVLDFKYSVYGTPGKIHVDATYSEFDAPFTFPMSQPYPACQPVLR